MHFRFLMVPALMAALAFSAIAPTAHAHQMNSHGTAAWSPKIAVDGIFGPETDRVVREFQRQHGLKADGIAGRHTLAALGLSYKRDLAKGLTGDDVRALQAALARHQHAGAKPAAKPKPVSKPKPSVRPTPEMTPEATWTPAPTPRPTPRVVPTPAPMVTESPTLIVPTEEPAGPTNTPTLEIKGGNWMVPLNALAYNYDYGFQRPTWNGEATLWLGDVGVGGKLTSFQPIFTGAGTYSAAMMYDGLLKYRLDRGFYNVYAGYRGYGAPDYNFGTLGLGMDRPLIGEWLWLVGNAQAGSNFGSAYVLDGSLGLGLRAGAVGLELGFREMLLETGVPNGRILINGPTVGLRLAI